MDFAAAWDAFAIGDRVKVSDGTPPPSTNTNGMPYRAWRSHNFTGTLIAKIDGEYRGLQIQCAPDGDATIAFTVAEGLPHTFEPDTGGA
jgi:hypothetical protein